MEERLRELKEFDETKTGVKGILETSINLTTIPNIFLHPPQTPSPSPSPHLIPNVSIPVVDLSATSPSPAAAIHRAAADFGFFQIINHGVPLAILDRTLAAVKAFHDQPPEVRSRIYRREMGTGVSYLSNVDLFRSKAASWRDTLQVRLPPPAEQVPEVCAAAVAEWDREVTRLGEVLMDLVGEGLGLCAGRLKEMTCAQGRTLVGHYYPFCPQPDLTVGIASHTDPGVLTVLMQGLVGGLQVKCRGGIWVDVEPIPGALVVNVGDLLQMMSNDEYVSVEHRVLANSKREPRVSVAVFFNPSDRERMFGPLPELVSPEKPAVYRQFTYSEFIMKFFSGELDGRSLKDYFRL